MRWLFKPHNAEGCRSISPVVVAAADHAERRCSSSRALVVGDA
jgi:hypothetical protein